MSDVAAIQREIRAFARARDWEQFHFPKNLLLALVGEVGELAELFQWRTQEQSLPESWDDETRQAVEDELADVFIYLLRLADVLDVDIPRAVRTKMEANAARYQAAEVRGSAENRP